VNENIGGAIGGEVASNSKIKHSLQIDKKKGAGARENQRRCSLWAGGRKDQTTEGIIKIIGPPREGASGKERVDGYVRGQPRQNL